MMDALLLDSARGVIQAAPEVKVRLFQELKRIFGKSELCFRARSIKDLLSLLVEERPEARDILYDVKGNLRDYVAIYRNNVIVVNPFDEDAALQEGDILLIVPPITGGTAGWEQVLS